MSAAWFPKADSKQSDPAPLPSSSATKKPLWCSTKTAPATAFQLDESRWFQSVKSWWSSRNLRVYW